jgi:hypothetical protein
VDRRAFLGTLGLLGARHAAEAQQAGKVWRIGILTPGAAQWQPAVFKQALRGLGYEEPTNLIIVVRDATGRLDMLPQLAGELVREQVDVIVAISTPGTRAAIRRWCQRHADIRDLSLSSASYRGPIGKRPIGWGVSFGDSVTADHRSPRERPHWNVGLGTLSVTDARVTGYMGRRVG